MTLLLTAVTLVVEHDSGVFLGKQRANPRKATGSGPAAQCSKTNRALTQSAVWPTRDSVHPS